jgi:hypothetical protein
MADAQIYTPIEIALRWLAALQHRVELMDGALGDLGAENKRLKARLDE